MKQWFYSHSGQQQGPIQEAELVAMLGSGKLQADALVWTDGLGDWKPARDIEGLVPTAATPPPIPEARTPQFTPEGWNAPFQSAAYDHKAVSGFGWYLDALKNYAVFQGRSRRKAYWMFYLFDMILTLAVSMVDTMLWGTGFEDYGPVCLIYTLATIIPYLAVAVRRMHDTGRSGWWILVPIANLVFLFFDSEPGDNRYGPNPKNM